MQPKTIISIVALSVILFSNNAISAKAKKQQNFFGVGALNAMSFRLDSEITGSGMSFSLSGDLGTNDLFAVSGYHIQGGTILNNSHKLLARLTNYFSELCSGDDSCLRVNSLDLAYNYYLRDVKINHRTKFYIGANLSKVIAKSTHYSLNQNLLSVPFGIDITFKKGAFLNIELDYINIKSDDKERTNTSSYFQTSHKIKEIDRILASYNFLF
ncbi:MAG: hypothetical protein DRQ51_09335 [Gammaproteobacteria bacterium]|nr:MAG: hypothetical protein DRQ51_09335 [Gammaproteobacteria bacterium]